MSNVKQMVRDPQFQSLSRSQQLSALGKADPEIGLLSASQQGRFLDKLLEPPAIESEFQPVDLPPMDGEPDWLKKNTDDFIDNTPLGILKDPDTLNKEAALSGGLGGSDIGELLFGAAYSIPRDIVKGGWNAGKNLIEGDPGAALGQAASLGAPKMMRGMGKGLRGSAERSMVEALGPVDDAVPRAQELAPRMLDDFDAGAFTRQGLLDKFKEQKSDRFQYTKPAEQQLANEPVTGIDLADKVADFIREQGRVPVGRGKDLSRAGDVVNREVIDLLDADPKFADLLKAKESWADTARETFDKPPIFRDPEQTPRAEASKSAWSGAKSELDQIAMDKGFDDYPKFNKDISDLIDMEKMTARGQRSGTLLGSVPNRVLGWLMSPIASRVLGGELGSRIPSSVGFNTSSAYTKNMLSQILEAGGNLSPAEMAILTAMMQDENMDSSEMGIANQLRN